MSVAYGHCDSDDDGLEVHYGASVLTEHVGGYTDSPALAWPSDGAGLARASIVQRAKRPLGQTSTSAARPRVLDKRVQDLLDRPAHQDAHEEDGGDAEPWGSQPSEGAGSRKKPRESSAMNPAPILPPSGRPSSSSKEKTGIRAMMAEAASRAAHMGFDRNASRLDRFSMSSSSTSSASKGAHGASARREKAPMDRDLSRQRTSASSGYVSSGFVADPFPPKPTKLGAEAEEAMPVDFSVDSPPTHAQKVLDRPSHWGRRVDSRVPPEANGRGGAPRSGGAPASSSSAKKAPLGQPRHSGPSSGFLGGALLSQGAAQLPASGGSGGGSGSWDRRGSVCVSSAFSTPAPPRHRFPGRPQHEPSSRASSAASTPGAAGGDDAFSQSYSQPPMVCLSHTGASQASSAGGPTPSFLRCCAFAADGTQPTPPEAGLDASSVGEVPPTVARSRASKSADRWKQKLLPAGGEDMDADVDGGENMGNSGLAGSAPDIPSLPGSAAPYTPRAAPGAAPGVATGAAPGTAAAFGAGFARAARGAHRLPAALRTPQHRGAARVADLAAAAASPAASAAAGGAVAPESNAAGSKGRWGGATSFKPTDSGSGGGGGGSGGLGPGPVGSTASFADSGGKKRKAVARCGSGPLARRLQVRQSLIGGVPFAHALSLGRKHSHKSHLREGLAHVPLLYFLCHQNTVLM